MAENICICTEVLINPLTVSVIEIMNKRINYADKNPIYMRFSVGWHNIYDTLMVKFYYLLKVKDCMQLLFSFLNSHFKELITLYST